jgi:hypothetical protein
VEVRYRQLSAASDSDVVPVEDVEPPQRDIDIEPFNKHRLVPVAFGLQSQHGVVPPVEVVPNAGPVMR